MKWKIFYGDGSTYSNEDGSPELAPKRNVQIVIHSSELVGFSIEREEHYYLWQADRGGWTAANEFGLYDYLIDPGFKIVLFGRTLNLTEYQAILNRAIADPDVPRKSAWLREERRP